MQNITPSGSPPAESGRERDESPDLGNNHKNINRFLGLWGTESSDSICLLSGSCLEMKIDRLRWNKLRIPFRPFCFCRPVLCPFPLFLPLSPVVHLSHFEMLILLLLLAPFLAPALAAIPVTLHALTSNPSFSNVGLYALPEGAGTSYFFLGRQGEYSAGEIIYYDRTNGSFHSDFALTSSPPYYLTVADHLVQFTTTVPEIGIDVTPMGLFSIAGSTKNFFACNQDVIRDPFGYTSSNYVAMYFPSEVPLSCIPFSIKVQAVPISRLTTTSSTGRVAGRRRISPVSSN
ncbi:hypothetical protein BZA70DRAFT_277684 [Myxozyma melibiosi]|uniref:Uncharacterized protein n=1 Tax=Myxozyma melibiosi TaxID=54550 RepID=A0ABR1F829_9ASCO